MKEREYGSDVFNLEHTLKASYDFTLYKDKKCKEPKGTIKAGTDCRIINVYYYTEQDKSGSDQKIIYTSIYVVTSDGTEGWLETTDESVYFSDAYYLG